MDSPDDRTDDAGNHTARLCAACFILGALSWGLIPLVILRCAGQTGNKLVVFHAKQSFIWNLIVGVVLVVAVVALVSGVILLGSGGTVDLAFSTVQIALIGVPAAMIAFAWIVALTGAWRVLHGRPFRYPIIGAWVARRTRRYED